MRMVNIEDEVGATSMETPVEIDFQGFNPSEWQVKSVRHHMDMLEKKFQRISSGRIIVKWPGEHHRSGGLYEINIRLRLPTGKEVDVSRTSHLDERHADFNFALNDAFKRARRQLQDKVRKLQGKVKVLEGQPVGRVIRLFEDHGFLESADGLEIYFHRNSVLNGGFAKLKPGTLVYYAEELGEKGPQAGTVKFAGKHGML
jgi:cold shock CspA family protein